MLDSNVQAHSEALQQTPPPKSHMMREDHHICNSGTIGGKYGSPSRIPMPFAAHGHSDNELAADPYLYPMQDIVYSQHRGPHPQMRNIFITKKIKTNKTKGLEPLTASPYASIKRNGGR